MTIKVHTVWVPVVFTSTTETLCSNTEAFRKECVRVSRKRRPKTKDLEKEDPLENEDLEKEDPLENEDLENEDPLEKHENTKQKIEAESSLAYLQISKMAETWPGVSLALLQVPVLFSDKRAQNK